jgi:hypothetical protein
LSMSGSLPGLRSEVDGTEVREKLYKPNKQPLPMRQYVAINY